MPTDTKLQQLIINTLTAEQMPTSPSPTEIWLQEDTGEYATEEYVNNHHDDTKQDALGFTPARESDLTTHTGNGTIHVTANDKAAWSQKQNKLVAGANIAIDESTNTISATGGTEVEAYTASEVQTLWENN